jgi:HEAT repeat protein
VATWKVRAEFRGHRDRVTAVAFGPDGRLFTGGLDTVVLRWDVRPPRDAVRGTLADAWEALTDADAKAAFQAQGRFLAEPAQAVEWLAARISPARPLDPSRVKALIADLDHNDFATRERATADLREHGPVAAAALREVVAKSSSPEARRRAEGLLREMDNGVTPPRELRALRAVEVLEWVATPEARARLLELTNGAPDARLTREAAAACKRLGVRK